MAAPTKTQAVKSAKQTRKGNRRAVLLEAAARCFVRDGYAASSMRDIAAEAGMQAGSIYYHFASKEELLVAVHEEGMRRITEAVTGALAASEAADPWARLQAAAEAHMGVLLEGGDFFTAVMGEFPAGDDPGRVRVTAMRDDYEAIFERLLKDLGLRRGTDRTSLRLMLLGAMNWSHSWYSPGGKTPTAIARQFVGFLREGLDTGS